MSYYKKIKKIKNYSMHGKDNINIFFQNIYMTFRITEDVNNKLAIILIIIMVLLFFPSPSSAIDNGYARIVYNVRGIQDYDLHWNDRFPQGSIIKIYTEADGINHRREVAVDYVYIIRDPNSNIVDTVTYSSRFHDYRENDFATYSKNIPADWEDGAYIAEIYIFDLLNNSVMDKYYTNLTLSYINGSGKIDVPVMSRSDVLNMSESENKKHQFNITKTFYIDKYASKYPMDRFRIENIMMDMKSVPPKATVRISATAVNTFYEKGSTSVSLLIDNKSIDSRTIELEGSSSQKISFEVSSEIEGDHTVEIVPTGNNTIGLNLLSGFVVNAEKKIEVPTTFVIKDMQINNLSVEPNQTVTISIIVENSGKDGSMPVELYINDIPEEPKDVYINFSSIKDVQFNITKAELGAYRVTAGGTNISKIFFVESALAIPTKIQGEAQKGILKKGRKPEFNIVLGLSVLVVFIFALRLYLRKKMK